MIAGHLENWLALLERGCASAGITHLDLIIDQAGSDRPLLPSVLGVEPALSWHSLFDDLPETGAQHLAPLLVRVDLAQPLQRQWLLGLMQACDGKSQLLALVCSWSFSTLAYHLGQGMQAYNGGRLGLLRFYDPRLFPLLFSHVLQEQQQQLWLRPALFWSWLDRDGVPQHLSGTAQMPGSTEETGPIELSDAQVDILCCASDATLAMTRLIDAFPCEWGAEQRFQVCYREILDANAAGLLLDEEREAFICVQLAKFESSGTEYPIVTPLHLPEPQSCRK